VSLQRKAMVPMTVGNSLRREAPIVIKPGLSARHRRHW
jgi:hypothetical protein